MKILDALTAVPSANPARLDYGTVTDDSPLTVQVGASTVATPCARLASYTPGVGDYVAVLIAGADRIVLGEVIA